MSPKCTQFSALVFEQMTTQKEKCVATFRIEKMRCDFSD